MVGLLGDQFVGGRLVITVIGVVCQCRIALALFIALALLLFTRLLLPAFGEVLLCLERPYVRELSVGVLSYHLRGADNEVVVDVPLAGHAFVRPPGPGYHAYLAATIEAPLADDIVVVDLVADCAHPDVPDIFLLLGGE